MEGCQQNEAFLAQQTSEIHAYLDFLKSNTSAVKHLEHQLRDCGRLEEAHGKEQQKLAKILKPKSIGFTELFEDYQTFYTDLSSSTVNVSVKLAEISSNMADYVVELKEAQRPIREELIPDALEALQAVELEASQLEKARNLCHESTQSYLRGREGINRIKEKDRALGLEKYEAKVKRLQQATVTAYADYKKNVMNLKKQQANYVEKRTYLANRVVALEKDVSDRLSGFLLEFCDSWGKAYSSTSKSLCHSTFHKPLTLSASNLSQRLLSCAEVRLNMIEPSVPPDIPEACTSQQSKDSCGSLDGPVQLNHRQIRSRSDSNVTDYVAHKGRTVQRKKSTVKKNWDKINRVVKVRKPTFSKQRDVSLTSNRHDSPPRVDKDGFSYQPESAVTVYSKGRTTHSSSWSESDTETASSRVNVVIRPKSKTIHASADTDQALQEAVTNISRSLQKKGKQGSDGVSEKVPTASAPSGSYLPTITTSTDEVLQDEPTGRRSRRNSWTAFSDGESKSGLSQYLAKLQFNKRSTTAPQADTAASGEEGDKSPIAPRSRSGSLSSREYIREVFSRSGTSGPRKSLGSLPAESVVEGIESPELIGSISSLSSNEALPASAWPQQLGKRDKQQAVILSKSLASSDSSWPTSSHRPAEPEVSLRSFEVAPDSLWTTDDSPEMEQCPGKHEVSLCVDLSTPIVATWTAAESPQLSCRASSSQHSAEKPADTVQKAEESPTLNQCTQGQEVEQSDHLRHEVASEPPVAAVGLPELEPVVDVSDLPPIQTCPATELLKLDWSGEAESQTYSAGRLSPGRRSVSDRVAALSRSMSAHETQKAPNTLKSPTSCGRQRARTMSGAASPRAVEQLPESVHPSEGGSVTEPCSRSEVRRSSRTGLRLEHCTLERVPSDPSSPPVVSTATFSSTDFAAQRPSQSVASTSHSVDASMQVHSHPTVSLSPEVGDEPKCKSSKLKWHSQSEDSHSGKDSQTTSPQRSPILARSSEGKSKSTHLNIQSTDKSEKTATDDSVLSNDYLMRKRMSLHSVSRRRQSAAATSCSEASQITLKISECVSTRESSSTASVAGTIYAPCSGTRDQSALEVLRNAQVHLRGCTSVNKLSVQSWVCERLSMDKCRLHMTDLVSSLFEGRNVSHTSHGARGTIELASYETEMSAEFLPLQVSCTVAPLEDCRVCISIHYQQLASSVNTTRLTKVKFVLKCPTVGSAIDASPAVARLGEGEQLAWSVGTLNCGSEEAEPCTISCSMILPEWNGPITDAKWGLSAQYRMDGMLLSKLDFDLTSGSKDNILDVQKSIDVTCEVPIALLANGAA